jgi:hypothetical protein
VAAVVANPAKKMARTAMTIRHRRLNCNPDSQLRDM